MPTPTNDQKLWFTEYDPAIRSRFQNVQDVYSGKFMEETVDGEEKIHYIRGQQEWRTLGSDFDSQDYTYVDLEKRKITNNGKYIANRWSHQEMNRMLVNPIPGTVQEQMNGLARLNAATKRDAITSTAQAQYEGEDNFTAKSLPTTMVVGNGTAIIDTDDFITVNSILSRYYAVQNGERAYCAIGQEEVDTLLKDSELKDTDFNGGSSSLVSGKVNPIINGVEVFLDLDINWSSTINTCPYWIKSAMVFHTQASPIIRTGELQATHFNPYAYMKVDNGSTRVRDFGAGKLLTLRSYTF